MSSEETRTWRQRKRLRKMADKLARTPKGPFKVKSFDDRKYEEEEYTRVNKKNYERLLEE